MQAATQQGNEVCPLCGAFVDELNEESGWCYDCSPTPHITESRVEKWLTKNADDIEEYMFVANCSAKQAIAILVSTYKAQCLICGKVIRHGTYGRHFLCNTTIECRRARRRYKYLLYDKGFTKSQAIRAITPQPPQVQDGNDHN